MRLEGIKNMESLSGRLHGKAERRGACLIWTGKKDKDGYGSIRLTMQSGGIKDARAHRIAYLLEHGELADDQVIRHTCDTPACIEGEHLIPGTNADNIADMVSRGRQAKGERTNLNKLSEAQMIELREQARAGESPYKLAQEYPVSARHIYKIKDGERWA